MVRNIFFVFLLCLLSSCMRERISVHTEYITLENLASYIVETPDPRKYCPEIGQRLILNWLLPQEYLEFEDLHLVLVMRLWNREEITKNIRVCKMAGSYIFYLLNDEFFDSCGILTYKVDLIGGGCVLESWRHQLWVELIKFKEDPS